MRSHRLTDKKLVVSIDALVEFFRNFDASMIPPLIELVEFATTHPQYHDRFPDLHTWLEADIATDVLIQLFDGHHGPPEDLDEAHTVTVNPRRGTITIRFPTHDTPPGPTEGGLDTLPPAPELPGPYGVPGPLGFPGLPPEEPLFPPNPELQARARWRRLRGPRG